MNQRTRSLSFKISFAIVVVEVVVLVALGFYYVTKFSDEIDQSSLERLHLPGRLMNSQVLRYESVADKAIMGQLTGGNFELGLIVGADNIVYYSYRKNQVGKNFHNVAPEIGADPIWISVAGDKQRTFQTSDGDDDFIFCIAPIRAYSDAAPFFYLLVKVNSQNTQAQKREMFWLFFAGSLLCVLLTSLALITYSRKLILHPLRRLEESADRLAGGELDQPIDTTANDEVGGLARSFATMRDAIRNQIAQLETVNQELHAKEQRLSAFVNALPDVVLVCDEKGVYKEVYSPQLDILAAQPDEIRGKTAYDVLPPDLAEKSMQVIAKTIRTAEVQTFIYELDTPSGVRWFEARCSLIEKTPQNTGSVAWAARDITNRVMLEDTLRKAKEDAEAANARLVELDQMKSGFLSSVSHELRTPLTSFFGFTKLIKKSFIKLFQPLAEGDKKLETRAKRIVDNLTIIEIEGERLTRLINNVLDLNKIESGRVTWYEIEVSPGEAISQAVKAIRGQVEQNENVELIVRVADDLPMLLVDSDRLVQVLINLLNNALKFTTEGEITIEAMRPSPHVVQFSVNDTGPGLNQADQEKIFDTFQQATLMNSNLSGASQGAGLGLAICRQIISHYGGVIWCDCTEGQGCSFIFQLPVSS